MGPSFATDWNWVIAGAVSALLVVGLSLLTSTPFLISAILSVLVFAGLVLLLSPRKLFEGLDVTAFGRGGLDVARDLLTQARPSVDRLRSAASRMRDIEAAPRAKHLAAIAADIFSRVEKAPMLAPKAKRFFSDYLPRTAEVVENFAVISGRGIPVSSRLDAARLMIGRLEDAFVRFSGSLSDIEFMPLDTELKLVEASLRQDLVR